MEWEDPRVKTPWGDEQREDLPLVWERPDPGSPQAYREDEIVSLWSSIFSLMSRLNYREPEDFIYPPKETGRHSFDKYDLLVDKGMSREAVSLAERLPFSRDVPNSDLILHKNSVPVSFFHHWHPKYCREITLPSEGRSMDKTLGKLLPQDFVFVFGLDPYSFDWILDLEYSKRLCCCNHVPL